MSDFLNEEMQRMNFLFGYKKGVIISEQSLENTPVGQIDGEKLGKAPSSIVELMKYHLENYKKDSQEVFSWCDRMKQKHGDGICVIGKSTKMNVADTKRASYEFELMKEKYKKVEDGPNLIKDDSENFYKVSYMIPKA